MPTPTAEDILDAAAVAAEEGVQSTSVDGRSATVMDPLKLIEAAKQLASITAGQNNRSAWGNALRSRAVPPGTV